MSPSATIAAVVAALVLCALLFQSDTVDPAWEAAQKRVQEKKQELASVRGANLTDAGVAKDGKTTREPSQIGTDPLVIPAGLTVDGKSPSTNVGDFVNAEPTTQPLNAARTGFSANARLNGTFVGVAADSDAPHSSPGGGDPFITFGREGDFTTHHMSLAGVEMEAATRADGAGLPVDRGSGRYRLSANTLELQYTDGLSRKKNGNRRSFTVVVVAGTDNGPTAITIQGKLFKLDPSR